MIASRLGVSPSPFFSCCFMSVADVSAAMPVRLGARHILPRARPQLRIPLMQWDFCLLLKGMFCSEYSLTWWAMRCEYTSAFVVAGQSYDQCTAIVLFYF